MADGARPKDERQLRRDPDPRDTFTNQLLQTGRPAHQRERASQRLHQTAIVVPRNGQDVVKSLAVATWAARAEYALQHGHDARVCCGPRVSYGDLRGSCERRTVDVGKKSCAAIVQLENLSACQRRILERYHTQLQTGFEANNRRYLHHFVRGPTNVWI